MNRRVFSFPWLLLLFILVMYGTAIYTTRGYTNTVSARELDTMISDSGSIAAWARPAMYWAYYNGVIGGMSATTLGPEAPATRAQLAKILVGYLDKLAS